MTERALAVAALLTIHSIALWGGFVDFDDPTVFLRDPLLTRADPGVLVDVFRSDDWRPLRDLSHWADYLVHGQTPALAHLHNLLLLGVVAWLAMAFFGSPALVLLAFAHPVAVEPVAWVSGRKDLLAAVFFFAMLLAFRRVLRDGTWRWGIATALCFVLAAMSKGHVLVAPAVLAVVLLSGMNVHSATAGSGMNVHSAATMGGTNVHSAHRRAGWATIGAVAVLALALVPLVASGAVMMSHAPPGAELPTLTFADRLALPALYAWSLVWPPGLNHIYLTHTGWAWPAAGAAVTLGLLAALARWRSWRLAIALLLLLPYLHVAGTGTVYRADRYLFLALPFLAPALGTRALVAALLVLAPLTLYTHTAWHDSVSLWSRMTRVYPTSAWGYERLGRALYRRALYEEAAGAWIAAAERDPRDPQPLNNAAVAFMVLGRTDMARDLLHRALALDPGHADARLNLRVLDGPPSRAPPSDRAPE